MSKFDIDWLVERSFTDENRERYLEEHYQPKLRLWSKKQFEMKTFQASDVFGSDEGMFTVATSGTAPRIHLHLNLYLNVTPVQIF